MAEPTSTERMIAALWQRNLPQIIERVALLERAAAASARGTLDPELQGEALSIAHKLAGSLGMFGFPEGTEIARELEARLQASVAPDEALSVLTGKLRKCLGLPADS